MKKYCVIGHPISHSRSPQLHMAGFQEFQIEAEFTAIDIKPSNLSNWIKTTFCSEYSGAAITIPHKKNIAEFVDIQSESAQKIGAINTLFWKNNKLWGTNTDCLGALRALETINPNIENKKILILGAGGASRAIVFALQIAKAHITIWNRTVIKAQELAEDFDSEYVRELSEIDSDEYDIIINTTSVGLNEWKSPFPESLWRQQHIAFDIVYKPLETKFLADAFAKGAQTITGDKMLVWQALEQFKIWHNINLEPEIMERAFFVY